MEHSPDSIFQWFSLSCFRGAGRRIHTGFEDLALIRVHACFQSANMVVIEYMSF